MANCEFCKLQDNCPGLNECVHWSQDAKRYNWLRSRKGLCLRSDCGIWTKPDGTKFTASHYLAEGDMQHEAAASLDETIDAAMQVRETPNSEIQGPRSGPPGMEGSTT